MSLDYYQIPEIFDSGIWARLSPSSKAIYPVLLKYANLSSRTAFPNRETILKVSGVKDKHAFARAIKQLISEGLIGLGWKPTSGPRPKRFYRLLDPRRDVKSTSAISRSDRTPDAISCGSSTHSERDQIEEKGPFLGSEMPFDVFRKKLVHEFGQEIVAEAALSLLGRRIRSPKSYLTKVCQTLQKKRAVLVQDLKEAAARQELEKQAALVMTGPLAQLPPLKTIPRLSPQQIRDIQLAKREAQRWIEKATGNPPSSDEWSIFWSFRIKELILKGLTPDEVIYKLPDLLKEVRSAQQGTPKKNLSILPDSSDRTQQ